MPARTGRRLTSAAAIGALIAVGLAACGGGGSTTSTTSTKTALTKSQLIAQGDAICKQASDQDTQLRESPPTTAEEVATLTQGVIDIQERQLSQLRELNPPASLKSNLDDYLKALEKNITVLKQGLKAAKQNDITGYQQSQAKTAQGQVQRLELARAVGFKECSRPAGIPPARVG